MRERETKQTREEEKNKEKPREKSRGVVAEALLDLAHKIKAPATRSIFIIVDIIRTAA